MTVYAIQCTESGRIKIGYTADPTPEARIKSMRTGSPTRIEIIGHIPGTIATETALHHEHKSLRLHGEWFKHEVVDHLEWANAIPYTQQRKDRRVEMEKRRLRSEWDTSKVKRVFLGSNDGELARVVALKDETINHLKQHIELLEQRSQQMRTRLEYIDTRLAAHTMQIRLDRPAPQPAPKKRFKLQRLVRA